MENNTNEKKTNLPSLEKESSGVRSCVEAMLTVRLIYDGMQPEEKKRFQELLDILLEEWAL